MTAPKHPTTDTRQRAGEIRRVLEHLSADMRNDIEKVEEPSAKALFKTSAEVLDGLSKALKDLESNWYG
jgi:uroporphyrinogen-III synthase